MKTIAIAIILLSAFFEIAGFGQQYEPFIRDSKEWRHRQPKCLLGGSCNNHVMLSYFIGDTVFNDVKYSKYYQKEIQPFSDHEALKYFIREDTINKKVYVYDFHFNRTALLYDFTLQEGDSFNVYVLDDIFMKSKVLNVDTIYSEGKKLKRISFENDMNLIEGIGFVTSMIIPAEGELICVKDGNSLLYINSKYNNCDTVFLQNPHNGTREMKTKSKASEISIFPVPVINSSILMASGEHQENLKIEIYNSIGICVRKDFFNGNYRIGLANLKTGLYIYKISKAENIVGTGKFIIN